MALTAKEQRQLLIDLTSGRISKAEYDEIMYNQRIRDVRTSAGAAPIPLTEAEKRLFYVALTRAKDELIITRSGDFSSVSSVNTESGIHSRYFLSELPGFLVVNEDKRLSKAPHSPENLGTKRFSRPSTRVDVE